MITIEFLLNSYYWITLNKPQKKIKKNPNPTSFHHIIPVFVICHNLETIEIYRFTI